MSKEPEHIPVSRYFCISLQIFIILWCSLSNLGSIFTENTYDLYNTKLQITGNRDNVRNIFQKNSIKIWYQ